METKICPQCGEDKLLHIEFSKNKNRLNGRACWCRACCKLKKDANREKDRKLFKIWYHNNKEACTIAHTIWRLANKDKRAVTDRKHYLKNKNKMIANANKQANALSDTFIKNKLRVMGFVDSDITSELIIYKRTSIQLYRELHKTKPLLK